MIAPSLATSFPLGTGIWISLICALIGLGAALYLIKMIVGYSPGNETMRRIAGAIEEGAKAYLNRQILSVSVIAVVIFFVLGFTRDFFTALGFLIGAACSMAAGYIGMRVAVISNSRTAQAATNSTEGALRVAFNGGAVTGLLVVGLGLLSVGIFFLVGQQIFGLEKAIGSLVGLALGASLISVFARLGGGIYTKAADVGADLVGKIESHLDEDDPRNPATIADNVGDNVGDCAGMAADVFETYAISIIGTMLVGFLTLKEVPEAVIYPFLLGGISVIGAIAGIFYVNKRTTAPGRVLVEAVVASGIVSAILYFPVTTLLFPSGFKIGDQTHSSFEVYLAALIGLAMTGVIVVITNYYTSKDCAPVKKIAQASETGHATNIIAGLAVGQQSTALPVVCIALAILLSYGTAGLYGVAVAVTSMLSMAGIIISLDAFGPITDNAGGVAVMSDLPKETRLATDNLDAIGNTMKAVTKGYAIASAGLAALVLFGSYVAELRAHVGGGSDVVNALDFSLERPQVIIGLFIGGLLPFLFSALSMEAVGKTAGAVVKEVRRQLQAKPGILNGTDNPEYGACVDIVTKAALREMIVPALLPVIFVIVAAFLGPLVLGGVLVGTIVTGLFVAISMTSGGGAWDNAKKLIEDGEHGGKGSAAHEAAVTGDTVGDPYKDTAGPAINPMIKVANIVAILIIPIIFK
ncbi:MAG: sodium-translocating pyrophosphatase [Verrucomicrobia bacterium]|nr:sodium-translocating pyrophosphatase [Verrucomicrobiota bacterium]MBV8483471.1 sodium-translocating pyrophosphatase [Verrucomicrobiota bacterium]